MSEVGIWESDKKVRPNRVQAHAGVRCKFVRHPDNRDMSSLHFTPASSPLHWSILNDELDRWHAAGLTASFWWRDDDAVKNGPRLEKLFALSEQFDFPLCLAVIPANLHGSLKQPVKLSSRVCILQHGYAHIDHSTAKEKGACELGLHRGLKTILDELKYGRKRLSQVFGDHFMPVVVPPWNRISDQLPPHLSQVGYKGLSVFGEEATRHANAVFTVANCHCDPVSWKRGGVFVSTGAALDQLVDRLVVIRRNATSEVPPTGYVTHHAVMDHAAWDFTEMLFGTLRKHPAAEFLTAAEVFSL
ncbi:MAG: hypothetical protein HKP56_03410 [Anderseniella sp.]|nr:hypothetical protein [Anderseniella sp.]